MYRPDRTELIAAAATALVMILIAGFALGMAIYLAGAFATFWLKTSATPGIYHGNPGKEILLSLAVWPLDAWNHISLLRK